MAKKVPKDCSWQKKWSQNSIEFNWRDRDGNLPTKRSSQLVDSSGHDWKHTLKFHVFNTLNTLFQRFAGPLEACRRDCARHGRGVSNSNYQLLWNRQILVPIVWWQWLQSQVVSWDSLAGARSTSAYQTYNRAMSIAMFELPLSNS